MNSVQFINQLLKDIKEISTEDLWDLYKDCNFIANTNDSDDPSSRAYDNEVTNLCKALIKFKEIQAIRNAK
jgi:hypothetical protein